MLYQYLCCTGAPVPDPEPIQKTSPSRALSAALLTGTCCRCSLPQAPRGAGKVSPGHAADLGAAWQDTRDQGALHGWLGTTLTPLEKGMGHDQA